MSAPRDARHLFCVYVGNHSLLNTRQFHLCDSVIAHRVHRVLRLRAGDQVQLFSDSQGAILTLGETKQWKQEIVGELTGSTPLQPRNPALHLGIGLLKKEALEHAVFAATAAGASSITPLITTKSRSELSEREQERLRAQIIAACEQSKNVHIPAINQPEMLESFAAKAQGTRCWLDGNGKSLPEFVERATQTTDSISLLIGAEAGFTSAEEEMLRAAQWEAYRLTPTVLRAVEAVTAGVALVSGCIWKR